MLVIRRADIEFAKGMSFIDYATLGSKISMLDELPKVFEKTIRVILNT